VRDVFRQIMQHIGEGWHMTTAHTDIDHASQHGGTTVLDCRGACVRAKTDTGLTVIAISGEIDASNVDDLSRRARELVPDCGALIIDLADIDFIAGTPVA
jgi:hypothetical protein